MKKHEIPPEHLFDNILEKDEYIIKVIKPSKGRYWKAPLFPFGIPLFWPHFLILMALTLFTLPFFYARGYTNLYYAYTNKRLIVRSGIIGVDYRSLDYKFITASSVDVGLLDKGSNTGSLSFKSPTSSISFSYVQNPYELMKEIKDYMNSAAETQKSDTTESK